METLRVFAVIFGLIFVALGIMGFVPGLVLNGNLLGFFEVDPVLNFIHILSGVIALLAAARTSYARLYFQIFGIVYGLAALAGFWREGDLIFIHVNTPDNILHTVISLVSLYLGFLFRSRLE